MTDAADGSTDALRITQALYAAGAACSEVGCTLIVVHHPLEADWDCPPHQAPDVNCVCAPAGAPMKQWIVMGSAANYDHRLQQGVVFGGH